jgi:tripartite-type tricarboxylate transporter receptor subunit TctC
MLDPGLRREDAISRPRALRYFRLIVVLGVAAILAPVCLAQSYPQRPIRIIALSSPGSGPDIVGRLVGSRLTEAWGQQVIVDPRPGATGIIGAEIAAKSPPDGYTLVIITSQAVIVSVMYDDLKYSLIRDFAPITLVATTPFILAVHPVVPATSIKQLIALARSKPGELRYGSGGTGSPPHLSAEIFNAMTGTKMLHVPYKGVTPAMVDTVAGQVHMLISVIPAILPTVKAGKLRPLGVTSAKRSQLVPDVPAIAETVAGYEFIGWYSFFAPAGTPPAIVNKLNAEIGNALQSASFKERITSLGAEPRASTPEELATYLRVQTEKMRKAVQDSGARRD